MKEIKHSTISVLRKDILAHKNDIIENSLDSIYFDKFIEVGFMDYFLYNFQEYYWTAETTCIGNTDLIDIFIQCKEIGDFESYCFFNKDKIFPLFFDYIEHALVNPFDGIPVFCLLYLWDFQDAITNLSVYPDYVLYYLVNAKDWLHLLDCIINSYLMADPQNIKIQDVQDDFTDDINRFPENIQNSIYQNIGLYTGIPIYDDLAFFGVNPLNMWILVQTRISIFVSERMKQVNPLFFQKINVEQILQMLKTETKDFVLKYTNALMYNEGFRKQKIMDSENKETITVI